MTIYKYRLPFPVGSVTLPEGAHVLTVQIQNGFPVLWALVNPDARPEPLHVLARPTGGGVLEGPEDYLGTVQFEDGTVWHYFRSGDSRKKKTAS